MASLLPHDPTPARPGTYYREAAVFLVLAGLLTYPLFFEIYRSMAFETSPRDDYGNYLLYLLGDGGHLPVATFAYRILSVLAAAPIYVLVPPIPFSNLEAVDPQHLRATQALAATSYLAVVATAAVLYLTARQRLGCSPLASACGSLLAILLFHFTSMGAIDPFGIMTIAVLLYFIENRIVFTALILTSVVVNEKILFTFFILFGARLLFDPASRRVAAVQAGATALAFVLYFTMVAVVDLPGYLLATDSPANTPSLAETLAEHFSLRGLVLNLLPVGLLIGLGAAAAAFTEKAPTRVSLYRHRSHFLVPVGLFLVCQIPPGADFGAGRITMYSFPVVLLMLVPVLARLSDRLARPEAAAR